MCLGLRKNAGEEWEWKGFNDDNRAFEYFDGFPQDFYSNEMMNFPSDNETCTHLILNRDEDKINFELADCDRERRSAYSLCQNIP